MPAPFSINLVDAAKQHLSFLQDAHREGITLSPVTKHALERYVNIWLRVVVSTTMQCWASSPTMNAYLILSVLPGNTSTTGGQP
jgi:hypothetical protein